MNRIKIPFTVSREERALIKDAYLAGVESADKDKLDYIIKHLPRVLKRLRKTDEPWLMEVADVAEHFVTLLRKDSGVSKDARKELVAALYYLCHPFEVIPDYVPGRGYADDALVLNTCMSRLRQRGVVLTTPEEELPVAD